MPLSHHNTDRLIITYDAYGCGCNIVTKIIHNNINNQSSQEQQERKHEERSSLILMPLFVLILVPSYEFKFIIIIK